MNAAVEMHRVRVVNTKDVDIGVRDAYGVEHVLFPKEEKHLPMLTQLEKSHVDIRNTGRRS